MVAISTAKTWKKESLQALQSQQPQQSNVAAWFSDWQKEQLQCFLELGFPNRYVEDWKYTNVADVANHDFSLAKSVVSSTVQPKLLKDTQNVVFIDGIYQPDLSEKTFEKGLRIVSLLEALSDKRVSELLKKKYAQQTMFSHLNAALLTGGIFIDIADQAVINKPIRIVHISVAQQPVMTHTRHIICLGKNAQATIFEEYCLNGASQHFNNMVTQIEIGPGAILNHYKLQMEAKTAVHIASTLVDLQKEAVINAYHFLLGAKLSRDDLQVSLCAPHSSCHLLGFYQTQSGQHIDNHTRIDHLVEHCESAQNYRGVISEKSRAVFNGKIIVHENAKASIANQENKNLLLAKSAEVDAKPELEIYNDDVKCSHGATVGQLDENALFYLKSRGISASLAKQMLTRAFANEIFQALPENHVVAQYIVKQVKEDLYVAQ